MDNEPRDDTGGTEQIEKQSLINDLETLNEIASVLNGSADARSALERALDRLMDVVGLESGWIFLFDRRESDPWWGKQFVLVAHHNLPPALALDSVKAWKRNCECQTLCKKGKLSAAYNEVECSRLAAVDGDRRGLRVHASTPLRSSTGEALGILNVAAPAWDAFSPRSLALLTNVGGQMGVALERARLFDLLEERRVHEQALLLDFSNQLLGRLDLEDLLHLLVEEVMRLLQVDACAVLLPDEEAPEYLRFSAAAGWRSDPVAAGRRVPADDRSGSGMVMRTQEPIVLADARPQEQAPWMADWLPAEEFLSAAMVPLVADGRSIGSLVVDQRSPRHLQEDEVRFLRLMANQAALAIEKARLHHEEIQRHRLEEELSVARQIQLSMLPNTAPVLPGWEIAAHYEAAQQVGGDFYDFFWVSRQQPADKKFAMVVADVTGKGVPAALFMALSRTTIRNLANGDRSPAATLELANRLLLEDSHGDLLLSAVYGLLDPDTGELVYCNAGHNPPLFYHLADGSFTELRSDGILLGVLPDVTLPGGRLKLAIGDLLVLYTDGVTETMNPAMEEFGTERLRATVAAHAGASAQAIVDAITTAVHEFAGEMPAWDDLTLVIARRLA
ncbi:MAG: SpoIIE family protein phosphatase [Anaerolineae bacterium]|nr:SpoIIE family protein phosphatase [Anaerolineae bacterium]